MTTDSNNDETRGHPRMRRAHIGIIAPQGPDVVWSIAVDDAVPAGHLSLLGLALMGSELAQNIAKGLGRRFSMDDPTGSSGNLFRQAVDFNSGSAINMEGFDIGWVCLHVASHHKKPWSMQKSIEWIETQLLADYPKAQRIEAPDIFDPTFGARREAHFHAARLAFEIETAVDLAVEIAQDLLPGALQAPGSKPRI